MAYRRPLNGEWPDFFSTSDLNALIEIWLTGDRGNDFLWGGLGANRIRLSEGNDVVWGFSALEGDRLEISKGLGYSLLELGGNIELASGLGVTVFMGVAGAEEVENAVVFV